MDQIIMGLIQTIIFLALAFFFVYKYSDVRTKTTHFECPACGLAFKLSKLSFAFALKKGFYLRLVTCPACGYRGWMEIIKD